MVPKKAEILEAGIFDVHNFPAQVLQRNNEYLIKVKVRHNESMPAAIVAYTIRAANGQVLCGTNTLYPECRYGADAVEMRLLWLCSDTLRD